MKALLIIFLIVTSFYAYSQTGNLSVSLKNVNSKAGGKVYIALFKKSGFPLFGQQFKGVRMNANSKVINFTFEDLRPGNYAIAIFHDENNDGKLNKNFFGAPTEGYGFSNDARGTFGPPSFESAAIPVKINQTSKNTIRIRY